METAMLPVVIGSLGAGLMVTLLVHATLAQGTPLEQLGKRPMGRGLWTWLYNGALTGEAVGTSGYDPALGAFAPLTRLLLHWSVVLLLWAAALSYAKTETTAEDESFTFVWITGGIVALLYGGLCHFIHHMLPGVSIPGGPRPHKIQRHPQWAPGVRTVKGASSLEYAQAKASHEWTTEERFQNTGLQFTGEPSGRDVWMPSSSSEKKKANSGSKWVDERVVQEMASGGRFWGFDPSVNPNSADQVFRAQQIRTYLQRNGGTKAAPSDKNSQQKRNPIQSALHKAIQFYSMLQTDDGHWSGDYGGPMFLMPGLIVVWYAMGQPTLMLNEIEQALMKEYMINHQQTDGGWGTHIESPSTMFGTVLNYVALRLLGMAADDPVAQQGRAFIREQGGALYTSSWAKFYLCLLGCMHWDGHNSVPPEMWLLPNWIPFHPGRMWCHARMVYLPMGYLYGVRFVYAQAEKDPIVQALREELYVEESYDSIPWITTRHFVAPMDNYSPIPWTMEVLQNLLARYETWSIFQPFKNLVRHFGIQFSLDYMAAEDLQTNFIDIGPVNKVLNCLSAFHGAGNDLKNTAVVNHMARVSDYLWLAEDGMKMKGYNGSQSWDTSFAVQSFHESGMMDEFPEAARKVWSYLERTQILSTEVSQATAAFGYESAAGRRKCYRHVSQGGWPFSTSAHGWPISDCTGEGLKGVLCLLKSKTIQAGLKDGSLKAIDNERLQNAANVLLSYQNEDGGWATYENNRGFGWYESLNPSEVFGDIMIDYSYVECSMASITGLVDFHETFPDHRTEEIQHAIAKGRDFLKSIQREDGSWYGSWACCFCYGAWFGVEGLIKSGEPRNSETIQKACEFLIKNQRHNGGWGEDFTACFDKDYPKNGMEAYGDEGSGVVNTGWALLALSAAEHPDVDAVRRGVQYLLKRQLPCGDWPQEGIAGVFNRACGITYTAYRNVFPIWAIGRCQEVYGDKLLTKT